MMRFFAEVTAMICAVAHGRVSCIRVTRFGEHSKCQEPHRSGKRQRPIHAKRRELSGVMRSCHGEPLPPGENPPFIGIFFL